MDRQNARVLRRLFLAVFTGIAVSWLAVLTLVALSFLWPANQLPHALLGVWLGVIAAYLLLPARPDRESNPDDNWPRRTAFAPLVGPVFWIGLWLRKARG